VVKFAADAGTSLNVQENRVSGKKCRVYPCSEVCANRAAHPVPGGIGLSQRECLPQSATRVRSKDLLLASAMLLASAGLLHAQNSLPAAPAAPAPSATDQQVLPALGMPTGFTGTTSGPSSTTSSDTRTDSISSPHAGSSAAAPFKMPHTVSKTTDSGTKFQFTLPRIGFDAGQRTGQVSPLDSNGRQLMGARGDSMFPSDNNFLQPADAASNGMFDTDSSGMSGISGMPRGGHAGGGAGGPGLNVKSSIFDFHMGMSMKDMMGGSGGASTGSGFSMSGGSSGDFTGTGGQRTPGSEGRGAGAGPKLSLGLRF
jgi:hypothetical protein